MAAEVVRNTEKECWDVISFLPPAGFLSHQLPDGRWRTGFVTQIVAQEVADGLNGVEP